MKPGNQTATPATPASKPDAPAGNPPTPGRKPREAEDQIKRNQAALGVAEDHRTNDMKKGKRGTFP